MSQKSPASKWQSDERVSQVPSPPTQSHDPSKPISPYTLFLFTRSDFKTLVFPTVAFAVANVLSGCCVVTTCHTDNHSSCTSESRGFDVFRFGLAFIWTWTGLLIEAIANQRLPDSVVEDSVNKPWRPIPSSRISPDEARKLLIALIGPFYLLSVFLGVQGPCLSIIVFTYIYNDLKGADEPVLRNILNGCGLMSFGAGATIILGSNAGISDMLKFSAEGSTKLTGLGWIWMLIVGLVITTTISTQDLPDVEGDKERGRRTMPLIWGARATRLYLAASILLWNSVCVAFWQANIFSSAAPVLVSISLALNLVFGGSHQDDKRSWKLWCLWAITLYSLPALTSLSSGNGTLEGMLEIDLATGVHG